MMDILERVHQQVAGCQETMADIQKMQNYNNENIQLLFDKLEELQAWQASQDEHQATVHEQFIMMKDLKAAVNDQLCILHSMQREVSVLLISGRSQMCERPPCTVRSIDLTRDGPQGLLLQNIRQGDQDIDQFALSSSQESQPSVKPSDNASVEGNNSVAASSDMPSF